MKATLEEEACEAGKPKTPETGEGIRYLFKKDLRLTAGVHKVFVAVPEDDVANDRTL